MAVEEEEEEVTGWEEPMDQKQWEIRGVHVLYFIMVILILLLILLYHLLR